MNKTTLVLGATATRWRTAFQALGMLKKAGHSVYGIGKKRLKVFDIQVVDFDIDIPDLHTITIYLNKNNQKEYYDYIVASAPIRVIFNPGSENTELENILIEKSILFEHSCTLVLLSTGQY